MNKEGVNPGAGTHVICIECAAPIGDRYWLTDREWPNGPFCRTCYQMNQTYHDALEIVEHYGNSFAAEFEDEEYKILRKLLEEHEARGLVIRLLNERTYARFDILATQTEEGRKNFTAAADRLKDVEEKLAAAKEKTGLQNLQDFYKKRKET